jgi:hypothetical protein
MPPAAAAAATATTAPSAAPPGVLLAKLWLGRVFLVENVERAQADVRNLLFAEEDLLIGSGILGRHIRHSRG